MLSIKSREPSIFLKGSIMLAVVKIFHILRALSGIVALTLLSTFSLSAFAAGRQGEPIQINVGTVNASGAGYTFTAGAPGVITITENGWYSLTGTTTANQVIVQSGRVDVNVELLFVSIDRSAGSSASGVRPCALSIEGARVNLTLIGHNTLTSGDSCAGVYVPNNATLTIGGTGRLEANGGGNGAGIGSVGHSGNITINSGEVIARGAPYGAGIGGGNSGNGGNITINGGTVTASSAQHGAGIGGGATGGGGNIVITGGTVIATGGVSNVSNMSSGAGIGGGSNNVIFPPGDSGNITITGNSSVTATGGSALLFSMGGGAGIGTGGSRNNTTGAVGTIIITPGAAVTASSLDGGANIGYGGRVGGNGAPIVGSSVTPSTTVTYRAVTATATPAAGGTIATLPAGISQVPNGANQSFAITPNTGYRVASVAVSGTNVGAVRNWTVPNIVTDTAVVATFEQILTSASISVAAPVAGATPNTAVTACGTGFTCSAVTWTPAHSPFQSNTQYVAVVRITANIADTFDPIFTATINGYPASVTGNNTGSAATLSYQFAATEVAIVAAPIEVTAPVTGATPNTAVTSCGTDFTCSAVTWTPTHNPYQGSTQYTASITLTANAGYTFAGMAATAATINGNSATATNNTGNTVTLSYEFAATDAVIATAPIAIIEPVTGATPNTAVTTCGTDFTCSAVAWTPSDDPFEGSTQYTAEVTLTANAGHTFTGLAATAATINGNRATVANNTGGTLMLSYEFAATDTVITSVDVFIAEPITNTVPSTTASGIGNFTAGAVTWAMTSSLFRGNMRYTAEVTLTADSGYTFTGLATATINGQPATVISNAGDTITLSFQFAATQLLPIPVLSPVGLVLLALALGGLAFRQGRRSA
jgi:hypothetical protein